MIVLIRNIFAITHPAGHCERSEVEDCEEQSDEATPHVQYAVVRSGLLRRLRSSQ